MGISKQTQLPLHPSIHHPSTHATSEEDLRPFRVCALDSALPSSLVQSIIYWPLFFSSFSYLLTHHPLAISPPVAPRRDYYIQACNTQTSVPASCLHNPRRTFQTHFHFHVLALKVVLHCCTTPPHILHTPQSIPPPTWLTPLPPRIHPTRCPRGLEVCRHCKQNALLQRAPTYIHTPQASSRIRTPSSKPLPTLASRPPVSTRRIAPSPTCQAQP